MPAKFTPAVMAWLRTYLDGLSDSLHGGHDERHDGRDAATGFDRDQGFDRHAVTSGNDRGDAPRNIYMSHADATVPAADTFRASQHFTGGAGGGLTFVNHSIDAATVYSGHHAGGEGVNAVTVFGGAGSGHFGGDTGTHDYLGGNSSTGSHTLFAGTGMETLASSTAGAHRFEFGLRSTGGLFANAAMSTGGAAQHSLMLGSSTTLTGSHAAGTTNLYDFMRGSATEPSGGTHYTVTDFNASDSTMFITDSTKAAGSFGADSLTRHVVGGAETLLADGSTISLKTVDPQSLVAHSSHNGGISIT